MEKKFWEKTTTDLGLWKGMNGWLETVIPYDEIAKPVNKSQAHLAAFIRNPKYQGNFVPETVSRNLIAKEDSQLSDEEGIQQFPNIPNNATTRYGLIRTEDTNTGRNPTRFNRDVPHWGNTGTVQYGLNFWPVVQNSHYTNLNRTYYNGFLAESMAYYTAYYQHWDGGIRNAASQTGWKGRNQNKKVVNTLDWKMSKKGEIYPGNKPTTISAVGVDIESLAQYGDFTTWPQIMWGNLPNSLEQEIVTEYSPWMSDILGIVSQEDFDENYRNKEFSMYQVNVNSGTYPYVEGTKALRLQQYCLPDHTSWVWGKMCEYLGANYSLQSFVDAICMIVQTSMAYPKLRPEFKSEYETITLNWLNQHCPIANQEWDKATLLAVNDLWRLISTGDSGQRKDIQQGSLGADVPAPFNNRRGTNNPNELGDADFSFNIAPPEELITQLSQQDPDDESVRTAQNLFNWGWMSLYSPGQQVTVEGGFGILRDNPYKNDFMSSPLRKMFPINQDGTLKDWQTPQGPISELSIGQWQQVCEMTELGPYPVRTKLIVYDRQNSTWAIQCDSQFINHHWYSEGTSNTGENEWEIPRELIMLEAEMPILNTVPYNRPDQISNLGRGGSAQMGRKRQQEGINLLCPNGAVDSQWWASFTSVEEGFCKYFPNYGWSNPKVLKMAWDQMARWERQAGMGTMDSGTGQNVIEAIPFERPFWATDLTYLEAWQKIYLGQQLAIISGQSLNQQISGFLSSGIWNRDFIMNYDGPTGILGQQNDLNDLIAEEPTDERRQSLIRLAGADTPEQFIAEVNQNSSSYYQMDASQVTPLQERQNDMTNFGSWTGRIGYQQRRGLQNLQGEIKNLGWVFGSESEVNQNRQEWNEEWQDVVESYDSPSLTVEQFAWPDNWNFAVNRNFAEPSAGTKFIINWTRILSYRIKTMLED